MLARVIRPSVGSAPPRLTLARQCSARALSSFIVPPDDSMQLTKTNEVEDRGRELTLLQKLALKGQDLALFREVVDGWRELHGSRSPLTLQAVSTYSQMLQDAGDLNTAEGLAREVESTTRSVFGPMHSDSLVAQSNLAQLLTATGRQDEAEPLAREALDGMTLTLGEKSPQRLVRRLDPSPVRTPLRLIKLKAPRRL